MADKKISQLTNSGTLTGTELVPIVQSGATVKTTIAVIAASETFPAAYTNLSTFGTVGIAAQGGLANANPNAGAETNYAGTVYTWVVRNPAATTTVWSAQLVQPSGAYVDSGDLVFKYQTTERFRLTSDGNFVPKTAGKGINFTANTPQAGMTSQLLNWYEEGTFTPTATAGSGTITSYTATGYYTRVGKTVTIFVSIEITNPGSASGNLNFAALPFTSKNVGGWIASVNAREDNVTGAVFDVLIQGNATTGLILSANWTTNVKYLFSATYLLA